LSTDPAGTDLSRRTRRWGKFVGAALALALASCGHKLPPPPPPLPPAPPPVAVIPPRPTPPDGASPDLIPPPIEADGQRESVNRKVSVNQIIWNLRSAYTVAALDCKNPRNAAILLRYRQFLDRNVKVLKVVYDQMDHDFRAKYGRGGETLRDDYLTVLYNHYALPPTKAEFCDVVDQTMLEGADVAPEDLGTFAMTKVPVIEKVFDDFYTRYDQYRNALAEWEERYGRVGRVSVGPLAQQPPLPPSPGPFFQRPASPTVPDALTQQPSASAVSEPQAQQPVLPTAPAPQAVPEPGAQQSLPPAIPEPQAQPSLPPAIPEPQRNPAPSTTP